MAELTSTDKSRNSLIFQNGPLEKAKIKILEDGSEKHTIPVQFNPNQYSISRTMTHKPTYGTNSTKEPENVTTVRDELANLSVSLVLDSATPMSLASFSDSDRTKVESNELTDIIGMFSALMKFDFEEHTAYTVMFEWGSLHFVGKIASMNINYTMFNRNGIPVRAKVDMTISGEDNEILKQTKSNPFESPDRTKYRTLGPADELWMIAQNEYSDPSKWREIAVENGILNPRQMDKSKMLKVPAI
ncbi:MAG: hypothetical protein R3Y67_04250 [Eubacteriales bacterium]